MLEFKTIETLKPNTEILKMIKGYTYKVKKGAINHILHTNLQVIEPTLYLITTSIILSLVLQESINELLRLKKRLHNFGYFEDEEFLKNKMANFDFWISKLKK